MTERSAYAVLGLQKGATEQDIKLAFVELVKKYDPEIHTDRFMVIQGAYNKLKDSKKRAKEDLHTYNVIKGDFLFTPEERCVDGNAPSDAEISAAQEKYRRNPGDSTYSQELIRLLMRRSHASVAKKLWSEAIRDWTEIQTMEPSNIRSRNNLMYAHITLGLSYALHALHDESIDLWEKALQLNPDNVELLHNLAIVCEKGGEGAKAARYWTETVNRWKTRLNKEGDNEYLRECIIEAHRYHGGQAAAPGATTTPEEKSQAINRFREVLQLKPDDFDAQYQIANSLIEEKKFPEAIKELEELVRKHPKNVEVLNLLAWAQINSGMVDQAFMTWNKSMALDPKNPATKENVVRAHLMLGKQYRQKGMFTPALVHLKKLLKFMDTPEVHMEIGATYDMKGDVRSAMQEYQLVLNADPKNKLARKALNDLKLKK